MRNPSLRGQRLCLQSSPSLALPDDIGGEIVRLVARKLHVRHLRVRVHQEARDRVGVEAGNLGDRRERRHVVLPVASGRARRRGRPRTSVSPASRRDRRRRRRRSRSRSARRAWRKRRRRAAAKEERARAWRRLASSSAPPVAARRPRRRRMMRMAGAVQDGPSALRRSVPARPNEKGRPRGRPFVSLSASAQSE